MAGNAPAHVTLSRNPQDQIGFPMGYDNALEEINSQYWVSFLNGPEAFANFRRSDYPALLPNPYPGSEISGDFIGRLTYPDS